MVDFGPATGRTKAGVRPALVVQNDKGNTFSPMTIVVPLTDVAQFKNLPVQVQLSTAETGLHNKPSCVECGHVTVIDEDQIEGAAIGRVSDGAMVRVEQALRVSLGL